MSRWKILKSTEIFKGWLFTLRSDECELPDGRVMPNYFVLDFPGWVNTIAVTSKGEMILVEQYRHAASDVFLEIPGGTMDSHSEDPKAAALRELLEETGYRAGEVIDTGFHFPNPALQTNKMHTYVTLNCEKVSEPDLDPFEDIKVKLLPVKEVYRRWENGDFKHSIIAASMGRAWRVLRERGLL